VTITAVRHDGFDGPIQVALTDLPAGLRATAGVILPGHTQVAVTLEAPDNAEPVTAPFGVRGEAHIGKRLVTRRADLSRSVPIVSVTDPPPVRVVSVEPTLIELLPGASAQVRVRVIRQQGFKGRVPLNLVNLPLMLTVPDIGLNGILITEQEDGRSFTLRADSQAQPLEQTLFVTARAEVNSGEQVEQASAPITLRVVKTRSWDAVPTGSAPGGAAPR